MSFHPVIEIAVKADARVVHAVQRFLSRNPDDEFIPAAIASNCGTEPQPTFAALAYLLEQGDIRVNVDEKALCWTFSARKRA